MKYLIFATISGSINVFVLKVVIILKGDSHIDFCTQCIIMTLAVGGYCL